MLRARRDFTLGKATELVRKTVVDVAVVRLVGADDQHYIAEPGIGGKAPIALCELGAGTFSERPSSISAR